MHLVKNQTKLFGKTLLPKTKLGETNTSNITTNTFENITSGTANIGDLNAIKLNSQQALISNILHFYDKSTDTTYIQNMSTNIVLKTKGEINSMRLTDSGNIIAENDLDVVGNISAINANLQGDISAVNINLLGELISTNAYITNQLIIDKNLVTSNAKITMDLEVDGFINVGCGVRSDFIEASALVKSSTVETPDIISQCDINITPALGHIVNIANVRHNINTCGEPVICPALMKTAKIFIVTNNVMIQTDPTCDGIEIIIYNNKAAQIVIRCPTKIIYHLDANCSKAMVFSCAIDKWILL